MKCDFCGAEAEWRVWLDATKTGPPYDRPDNLAYGKAVNACPTHVPLLRIVKKEPEKVDDGTWDSQGCEWSPNSGDPIPAEPERVSDETLQNLITHYQETCSHLTVRPLQELKTRRAKEQPERVSDEFLEETIQEMNLRRSVGVQPLSQLNAHQIRILLLELRGRRAAQEDHE